MNDPNLQERFAEELRKALGKAGDGAAGGSMVTVRAPDVTINPEIKLPELPQPLLVQDTGREPGAYVYKMTVKRQDGLIVDATLTPQSFIPLETFE